MVKIWCTLIINGRKTFDEVPKSIKDKVKAKLKEDGYGTDGKPLAK